MAALFPFSPNPSRKAPRAWRGTGGAAGTPPVGRRLSEEFFRIARVTPGQEREASGTQEPGRGGAGART